MNKIVIICGANSCGKSSTLKGFFGISIGSKSPDYYIERKLDGKIVCAVSFSSSQEKVHDFCNVTKVQEDIKRRVIECEERATSKPYNLIIPFTISGSPKRKKKVNKDCVLKPIDDLKKRFNVFVVYLRKTNTHNRAEKDALMKDVAVVTIETTEKDYDKSRELERFLKEKVL
jgi:hypothetical protein